MNEWNTFKRDTTRAWNDSARVLSRGFYWAFVTAPVGTLRGLSRLSFLIGSGLRLLAEVWIKASKLLLNSRQEARTAVPSFYRPATPCALRLGRDTGKSGAAVSLQGRD